MSLLVKLNSDVYQFCLAHATIYEDEEIMGLLLGDFCDGFVHIKAAKSLIRLDRQPDRVEIAPEQLVEGVEYADKRKMHVVGWYHSHPRHTVFPSAVDIKTQAEYQMMDESFVGLIFGTFNHNRQDNSQSTQVIGFRSLGGQYKELEIKLQKILSFGDFFYDQMQQLLNDVVHDSALGSPGSETSELAKVNRRFDDWKEEIIINFILKPMEHALMNRKFHLEHPSPVADVNNVGKF